MSPSFQNPPGRLSPEREAEIVTRRQQVPAGPWRVEPCAEEATKYCLCIVSRRTEDDGVEYIADAETPGLATWIAHAREDIDLLLAELAAVRAERDQARARVAELERPAEYERPVDEAPIPYVLTEQAEPVVSGCPRNVIGGDAGDHFFKKGALPDSPIACVYCGAKKPEGAAR